MKVLACGICRTDLHIMDGELAHPKLPLIPGHEIVGTVVGAGSSVTTLKAGDVVGIPWVGYTCGHCRWRVTKSISMNTLKQSATRPGDKFSKEFCNKEMKGFHHKLFELQNEFYADGHFSLLIILQGMDTAGKDGIIRHVLSSMNPMGIQVKSFKVPTKEEVQHDFLWRIFPHFPAKGMIEVFNRSYYEDIVVPFIGQKLTKEQLHERCELINALEKHLEDSGTNILKFFLNVSQKEQKQRIKDRLDRPHKRWKYDRADTVAADKYDAYMNGYDKIINECCSNEWHIIPSDQKWYRNYAVAKILTEYLEAMPLKYPGSKKGMNKPIILAQ